METVQKNNRTYLCMLVTSHKRTAHSKKIVISGKVWARGKNIGIFHLMISNKCFCFVRMFLTIRLYFSSFGETIRVNFAGMPLFNDTNDNRIEYDLKAPWCSTDFWHVLRTFTQWLRWPSGLKAIWVWAHRDDDTPDQDDEITRGEPAKHIFYLLHCAGAGGFECTHYSWGREHCDCQTLG